MTICYFGIYRSDFSRNRIYRTGLERLGVQVLECVTSATGWRKYWELYRQHRRLRGRYEVLIVGYPGYTVTWLAKLLSNRPVVLDALCTLHESVVISRQHTGWLSWRERWVKIIDWLAVATADIVLVETEAQRSYFMERFPRAAAKIKVLATGADDRLFYATAADTKRERFTVVFRGRFLPEAGVAVAIRAAKILEEAGVDFIILGGGLLEKEVARQIQELRPANLEWIKDNLRYEDLRVVMASCHASLGQLSDHPRLDRTVPHKAFESLAMGLPYITSRRGAIMEMLEEGVSCLAFRPGDAKDLAHKILELKNNPQLAESLGRNGRAWYEKNWRPEVLAGQLLGLVAHE